MLVIWHVGWAKLLELFWKNMIPWDRNMISDSRFVFGSSIMASLIKSIFVTLITLHHSICFPITLILSSLISRLSDLVKRSTFVSNFWFRCLLDVSLDSLFAKRLTFVVVMVLFSRARYIY